MSFAQDNKAIVARWFTSFWGKTLDLGIVEEIGLDDGVKALTQRGLVQAA